LIIKYTATKRHRRTYTHFTWALSHNYHMLSESEICHHK